MMPKYDFDPEFIRDIIFGDVRASDHPQIKVTIYHEPIPFKDEVLVGVGVEVPDLRPVVVREVLNLKRIPAEDLERTVWSAYHSIARKMSFRLFEKDPRIGLGLSDRFPNCPLFDPPYIRAPIRTYLKKGGDGIWKREPETVEVLRTLTTCHICETSIHPYEGSRRLGVWCGGNVGFAHEDCAPWVTPRH